MLDIGCGPGGTTRLAAEACAPGMATGVDIGRPMIERARQRAAEEGVSNVSFEQADAQTYPFAPHAFDVAISRFGVMFFDDPQAAFANIAEALSPAGRLAFVCWRDRADTELWMLGADVLAEWCQLPELVPGRPGPFSLTDPDRVRSLLVAAGFQGTALQPLTEGLMAGTDAEDAADFVYLDTIDEPLSAADEARARAMLVDALRPRETPDGVRLHSSAWLVTARV